MQVCATVTRDMLTKLYFEQMMAPSPLTIFAENVMIGESTSVRMQKLSSGAQFKPGFKPCVFKTIALMHCTEKAASTCLPEFRFRKIHGTLCQLIVTVNRLDLRPSSSWPCTNVPVVVGRVPLMISRHLPILSNVVFGAPGHESTLVIT